jgi:hypothetical protein
MIMAGKCEVKGVWRAMRHLVSCLELRWNRIPLDQYFYHVDKEEFQN